MASEPSIAEITSGKPKTKSYPKNPYAWMSDKVSNRSPVCHG
jgi:hypothetical protein